MKNPISKKQWVKSQIMVSAITLAVFFLTYFLVYQNPKIQEDSAFALVVAVFPITFLVLLLTFDFALASISLAVSIALAFFALAFAVTSISLAIPVAAVALIFINTTVYELWNDKSHLSKKFIWISLIAEFVIIAGAMNLVWLF